VIQWVLADIERECVAELEAMGFDKLPAKQRREIGGFVCAHFHALLKAV
jgi:hypothetical protein